MTCMLIRDMEQIKGKRRRRVEFCCDLFRCRAKQMETPPKAHGDSEFALIITMCMQIRGRLESSSAGSDSGVPALPPLPGHGPGRGCPPRAPAPSHGTAPRWFAWHPTRRAPGRRCRSRRRRTRSTPPPAGPGRGPRSRPARGLGRHAQLFSSLAATLSGILIRVLAEVRRPQSSPFLHLSGNGCRESTCQTTIELQRLGSCVKSTTLNRRASG